MKPNLYIIGARGLGREVHAWYLESNLVNSWNLVGCVDDNRDLDGKFEGMLPIVSTLAAFCPKAGDGVICAIGDSAARLKTCRSLEPRGVIFPTLKHNSATIGLGTEMGQGCILCPNVTITSHVRLGKYVLINVAASVGHDAQLGDGVTLSGHVDVTGRVVLEEGVFCGSHAVLLPDSKVGAYARIGAGSVVLRAVAAGTTVFGVPARRIN